MWGNSKSNRLVLYTLSKIVLKVEFCILLLLVFFENRLRRLMRHFWRLIKQLYIPHGTIHLNLQTRELHVLHGNNLDFSSNPPHLIRLKIHWWICGFHPVTWLSHDFATCAPGAQFWFAPLCPFRFCVEAFARHPGPHKAPFFFMSVSASKHNWDRPWSCSHWSSDSNLTTTFEKLNSRPFNRTPSSD